MAKPTLNVAASVRQRLLNLARHDGRDFQTVLVAFGLERLVWRLSRSPHRDQFFLMGGMLVTLWTSDPGRFTALLCQRRYSEARQASTLGRTRQLQTTCRQRPGAASAIRSRMTSNGTLSR